MCVQSAWCACSTLCDVCSRVHAVVHSPASSHFFIPYRRCSRTPCVLWRGACKYATSRTAAVAPCVCSLRGARAVHRVLRVLGTCHDVATYFSSTATVALCLLCVLYILCVLLVLVYCDTGVPTSMSSHFILCRRSGIISVALRVPQPRRVMSCVRVLRTRHYIATTSPLVYMYRPAVASCVLCVPYAVCCVVLAYCVPRHLATTLSSSTAAFASYVLCVPYTVWCLVVSACTAYTCTRHHAITFVFSYRRSRIIFCSACRAPCVTRGVCVYCVLATPPPPSHPRTTAVAPCAGTVLRTCTRVVWRPSTAYSPRCVTTLLSCTAAVASPVALRAVRRVLRVWCLRVLHTRHHATTPFILVPSQSLRVWALRAVHVHCVLCGVRVPRIRHSDCVTTFLSCTAAVALCVLCVPCAVCCVVSVYCVLATMPPPSYYLVPPQSHHLLLCVPYTVCCVVSSHLVFATTLTRSHSRDHRSRTVCALRVVRRVLVLCGVLRTRYHAITFYHLSHSLHRLRACSGCFTPLPFGSGLG